MANTFSALIPILYGDDQIVARELTGAIESVKQNFSDQGAGLNQTIRVPIAPANTTSTYTPAMTVTAGTDSVEGYADLVLNNNYMSTFNLTGEQMAFLMSKQDGRRVRLLAAPVLPAGHPLGGEHHRSRHLCGLIYKSASRATGTAGTAPYGSNLTDAGKQRKILDDNGCPSMDRHQIISTAAGLNLRGLTQLTNWLNVDSTDPRAKGTLLDLFGIEIKESAQPVTTTAGTGSGYLINNVAGYAIGATALTVDIGSGTILAGDIITLAGDSNNYVVGTALTSNVVTINKPGLRVATTDDTAITVGAAYTANLTLQRDSTILVARPPITSPPTRPSRPTLWWIPSQAWCCWSLSAWATA